MLELLAAAAEPVLTPAVQLELCFDTNLKPPGQCLSVNGRLVHVVWVRNLRARRYVLRLDDQGRARITIPRRGSAAEARRFAERNKTWLDRQLHRLARRPSQPRQWFIGTRILFRGESVTIESGGDANPGAIRIGTEPIPTAKPDGDLRTAIEDHLWCLAERELPFQVMSLAALHEFAVRRVTIRNQRSRWGSCSRQGTISLNWRLIQSPAQVQEYIILHELCHLRHMNHSRRFWREVGKLCPNYEAAERWLKQHAFLLER